MEELEALKIRPDVEMLKLRVCFAPARSILDRMYAVLKNV